jgi:hypothetical protein
MVTRDEFRAQVAAALFRPGFSVDQAVEHAIGVVAEQIAQTIDKEALNVEGWGIALNAAHLLHRADGMILAANRVRKFKEDSDE